MYILKQGWLIICLVIIVSTFYPFTHTVNAEKRLEEKAVLVIFTAKSEDINEHQRMIDMLVGHFTTNIRFVSISQLTAEHLHGVDLLIFDGQEKVSLSEAASTLIANFSGPILAIGKNVEQLGDRFAFFDIASYPVVIDQAIKTDDSQKRLIFFPQTIEQISIHEGKQTEIVMLGKHDRQLFPLAVKHQADYYFASTVVRHPFSLLLAELLHEFFDEPHLNEPLRGYIRLEDIHPFVDPEPLKEIADVLAEKNLPYMIAVIPVYTNPETKKQYHFSDSPKLLKVLKYMQDHGGSIVLHGYTHQFRLSETGEGFEFWDVEHNMPIYHGPDEEVIFKTVEDFDHVTDYEAYLEEQKAFERAYIEERLIKGIEELTNYGLYPLAFEAPHYTMSQQGYQVTSNYFTTYVGQLQLSDEDWEIMTTAPYMTKPTMLHGMTILPETLGYVVPDNPNAILDMISRAHDQLFVRDGMVAGFYHPYLGVDRFNALLSELEQFDEVEWINLKAMENVTQTNYVKIMSGNDEAVVDVKHIQLFLASFDYFIYHLKKVIHLIFWGMAMIGMLATIYFLICIIRQRFVEHREWRSKVG